MKVAAVLGDVMPYSLVDWHRLLEGTCHFSYLPSVRREGVESWRDHSSAAATISVGSRMASFVVQIKKLKRNACEETCRR
jgi:hypothetical protein